MRKRERDDNAAQPVEALGDVVMSSGTLVVIDFGLLEMWSHSEPPRLDHADPELMARANSAVDLQIIGPDASLVAERIDLAAATATFVFDMPPDSVEMVRGRVASIREADGLDADVVAVARMPHGDRVRELVELRPDGAEVPFHGPWAVALSGLPVGKSLPVKGVRMPEDSPDAGRWRSVWIEVGDGVVVESTVAGHVLVDEARLMLSDVDALGEWEHEESLDGLFDVAFWGRDAERVAGITGATLNPALGPGVFGWADLSFDQTREVATEVLGLQQDGELKFRAEVRPHSHHHAVLRQTATSPTESGSIDLAGGRGVGFFTSWGDGAFPVYRDVAADGRLVRVRVELGSDEIVERSRRS